MSKELQAALGLPAMDQVGFVYHDIEAAIAKYEPLFGPFTRMNPGPYEYEYRGTPEESELKLAFGRSGDIEIELIEWVSGGTPHKEFLDAGREGMHHLRFIVDDMEAMVSKAAELGFGAVWKTHFAPGLAVAYVERSGDPLLLEFFENAGQDAFKG